MKISNSVIDAYDRVINFFKENEKEKKILHFFSFMDDNY